MLYNRQLSQPATVSYTDPKGVEQTLTFDSFSEVLAVVKSLSEQGRYCEITQGKAVYDNREWLRGD